jgi:hypothetical protein
MASKQAAHLLNGAIAIIGQRLYHNRYAVRAVAFECYLGKSRASSLTASLLYRPLDVIRRHVAVAGFLYGQPQAEIILGAVAAFAHRHNNLAGKLGEQLPSAVVGYAFLPLYLRPLRMA